MLETGSDHRATKWRPLQSQRKSSGQWWSLHPEKKSVTLELAAIVLPLGRRGAYSEAPGMRPWPFGRKINGVMNLVVALLFLTSGVEHKLTGYASFPGSCHVTADTP